MKTLDDLKKNIPFVRRGGAKDTVAMINTRRYAYGWNDCIDYLHNQGLLMVWQPMETAPKDGTEIYTLLKNGRVAISSYNCFTNPKTGEHTRSGFYCDCPRCDTKYGLGYNGNPIAWMPLPKVGE